MAEQNTKQLKLRYQDVPDLSETFADSVGSWYFDGSTLRVEFLVTRMDPENSSGTRTGRKLPVCRLVLTATGATELLYQTGRIAAALEKAGLIKKAPIEKAP